jgi:hypothetical protein
VLGEVLELEGISVLGEVLELEGLKKLPNMSPNTE